MAAPQKINQQSDSYLFRLTQLLMELPFHLTWILHESRQTFPEPFKKELRLLVLTLTSAQIALRNILNQRIQERIQHQPSTEIQAKLVLETMGIILEILLQQLKPIQTHLPFLPSEVQETPEIAKLLQSFLRLQKQQNGILQSLSEFFQSEAPGFSVLIKEERVV